MKLLNLLILLLSVPMIRPMIIALVVGGVVWQSSTSREANADEVHAAESAGSQTFSVPIRVIDDPEKAKVEKQYQREASQRDVEDLAAQRAMAKAADQTVWLAKLQVALTLIGTIAILVTLKQSRSATRAALEAVAVSRETAERQLRAYLDVHSCRIEECNDGFILQAEIRNGGQTPAYDVRGMGESYAADYPDGGDRPHPEPLDTHSTTVGPARTITVAQRILTNTKEEVLRKVQAGEIGLWIQGKLVYKDAFGKYRSLKFRYVFGGRLANSGGLVMHADRFGNEAD